MSKQGRTEYRKVRLRPSSALWATAMQAATSVIRNLLRAALFLVLCSAAVSASVAANAQTLALVGGRVYPSPDAAPLLDAVVLASDGAITRGRQPQAMSRCRRMRSVIDCTGKTVVAGFWNSHVHFTEAVWKSAASGPAAPLTAHMQEMLTRWGFTTVWDLGSDPDDIAAAAPPRQCRRSRRPQHPACRQYLPQGRPSRLSATPRCSCPKRPRRMTPRRWRAILGMGHDGIKLFTGSFMGDDKPVTNMDAAVARAAVDVAHAQGKPVFAHPQNRAGVDVVIAAGVDVMAHTTADPGIRRIYRRTTRALQIARDRFDSDAVALYNHRARSRA